MLAAISVTAAGARRLPRWIAGGGLALAPALAIGALAFPLDSSAPYVSHYLWLPALLLWMPAMAIMLSCPRRPEPPRSGARHWRGGADRGRMMNFPHI
jgi:hypothetical protein